jgi:hypothetical protein
VGGGLGKITAALTWRLHRLADWLLLPRRFCCILTIFKYLLLFNLFLYKNNKYLKMNRVFLFFSVSGGRRRNPGLSVGGFSRARLAAVE